MEFSSPAALFHHDKTTLLLCFVVFYCLFWYLRKPKNIPPGPYVWPLIGNIPTIAWSLLIKEHVHDLMTRLSRRYGKVFTLGLGSGLRMVVLNDMESIKEAFQKPEISDRMPILDDRENVFKGKGVLISSGETWKHQRRFSHSVFRRFGVGKTSFEEQICVEASYLCDAIDKSMGKPFDPRPLLMNATSNMICSIVMGKRFDYDDKDFRQLLSLLDERVRLAGSGALQTRIPLLRMLRRKGSRDLLKLIKEQLLYFTELIKDHKESLQETGEYNDLIDLYLKEIDQTKNEPEYVNEDHLASFADNLFAAGTETSSNTLAWCLLHVIAAHDVQERIREEIVATCGEERLPKYSDRSLMPFTEAVILEVQRLHTVVPLGVAHYANKTTSVQGYTIPQGSIVLSNLWAVHHDLDVWADPDIFRPARFLDEDGKVVIKEDWIPFCTGRRVCLGERLAKVEIFVFLTHLLRRFSFKTAHTTSKLTFEGRSGVTYGPMPYEVLTERIE